jgi:hypothetical protein
VHDLVAGCLRQRGGADDAGGGERELRHRQRAQLVVAEIGDAGRHRGRTHADQARQAGHQVGAPGVGRLLHGPVDVADDVFVRVEEEPVGERLAGRGGDVVHGAAEVALVLGLQAMPEGGRGFSSGAAGGGGGATKRGGGAAITWAASAAALARMAGRASRLSGLPRIRRLGKRWA